MGQSSSQIPQPPLPNLAIHVYSPQHKVFQPGELVRGHIALTPVVPISPQAIDVALFGRSLIWYRTESRNSSNNSTDYYHWRDNAPLFEVAENVFDNGLVNKDGNLNPGQTYIFPFSFQFPERTWLTRVGQYKDCGDERWLVCPHDLPPTFLHKSKYGEENKPDYAKIEYGLRVRLVCPGVFVVQGKKNMVDVSSTAPILFQPTNRHLEEMATNPMKLLRHAKQFSLQSSTLAGQAPNQIGLRQSMRDRFSSATPKLDFVAAIEIPDLLASGTEFRFRATFSVVKKTDNVTQIPPICFSIMKVEILSFTFVRANRDKDASNGRDGVHRSNKFENTPPPDLPYQGGHQHEVFDESKTVLNSIPSAARVELGPLPPSYTEKDQGEKSDDNGEGSKAEQAESCDVWFTARVPGSMAPMFKSFAITRVYRVKIKLVVEIGDKKFTQGAESHVRYLGGTLA